MQIIVFSQLDSQTAITVAMQSIYRFNPSTTGAYRLYNTACVNLLSTLAEKTASEAFNGSVIYDGSSYTYDLAIAAPFRASEDIPICSTDRNGSAKADCPYEVSSFQT